ncbi:MAG: hypothetical protein ACJASX_001154, partial [Limisphaerales bacterium]
MNYPSLNTHIRNGWLTPQVLLTVLFCCLACKATGSTAVPFQAAPEKISEYLRNSSTPIVTFNPQRDHMLIYHVKRYSDLGSLSHKVVRLAGLEISSENNGPHRANVCLGLSLKPVYARDARHDEMKIGVPRNARLSLPTWSPTGKHFALMRLSKKEIMLYLGNTAGRRLTRINEAKINGTLGTPIQWLPDGNTLLCRLIHRSVNDERPTDRLPVGPNVIQTTADQRVLRPYRDLLQTDADADLFDYYTTCQLALVNAESADIVPIGEPGVYSRVLPSPDGQYFLVTRLPRPYSRELPATGFAQQIEIWNRDGELIHSFDPIPAREKIPVGGVLPAPRNFHWRPTQSAELVWVQPIDGGDPTISVTHRDRVMKLTAPFLPQTELEFTRTEHRFLAITWGEEPQTALIREYDQRARTFRTYLFNPESDEEPQQLLWERNPQDRYNDPGSPLMRVLPNGQSVMR